MKWQRWIVVGLVIVAVAGAGYVAFRPRPIFVDMAAIERGELRVMVEEDGETRIRETYAVSAPLAGRLQRIELEPGDGVRAGQTLLASIEPRNPELLDARSREEAEARVAAAEAAVRRAEAAVERAVAELDIVRNDAQRLLELYERGASTNEELSDARLRERIRVQEHRAAEYDLEIRRFEQRLAEAALVRTAGDGEGDPARQVLPILSPVTGRVLQVFQESATVVTAGTPLLEVGNPADLELVVDVLSTDAVRIDPGDEVVVTRWGGEGPLSGIVRTVEPAAFTKVSALGVEEQRVNVIIDLLEGPEKRPSLGDGYRVEVGIVVWDGQDRLLVPTGALFRRGQIWMVYAVVDDRASLREVTIGRQNGIHAELLTGVDEGEVVIEHPGDDVTDGMRVSRRTAAEQLD